MNNTEIPNPASPTTVTSAPVEHMSNLAEQLAAAGVVNPIPTVAAPIFGANTTTTVGSPESESENRNKHS